MKFYKCKVRVAGSLHNEVDKIGVSAPEVMVLRAVHGDDSVIGVKETAEKQVQHPAERERLTGLYGPKVVATLFGASQHTPLPLEAPGVTAEEPVDESEPVEKPVLPAKAEGLADLAS